VRGFLAAGAGALMTGAALAAPADGPPAPNLAPADLGQYQRFLHADRHRAFAIGPTGQFGWSADRDNAFSAILGAVYLCNKAGKALCAAYAVDESGIFGAYDANVAASNAVLAGLRGVSADHSYDGEDGDDGVAPRSTIERWNLPGDTPVSVPEGRLILTRYVLAQVTGADRPVLIDVTDSWGDHGTLPGAIWMRGAGDDAADKNADVMALFTALLGTVAPDRNTPLIVFCESRRWWSSYNAALRAVGAGYLNVYWYRGGIAAWQAAKLPVVTSVVLAQLW
jgi:rhodanese-related sulfurtransferase